MSYSKLKGLFLSCLCIVVSSFWSSRRIWDFCRWQSSPKHRDFLSGGHNTEHWREHCRRTSQGWNREDGWGNQWHCLWNGNGVYQGTDGGWTAPLLLPCVFFKGLRFHHYEKWNNWLMLQACFVNGCQQTCTLYVRSHTLGIEFSVILCSLDHFHIYF